MSFIDSPLAVAYRYEQRQKLAAARAAASRDANRRLIAQHVEAAMRPLTVRLAAAQSELARLKKADADRARDALLDNAIEDGRIPAAQRGMWEAQHAIDASVTTRLLASLPAGNHLGAAEEPVDRDLWERIQPGVPVLDADAEYDAVKATLGWTG